MEEPRGKGELVASFAGLGIKIKKNTYRGALFKKREKISRQSPQNIKPHIEPFYA